MGVNNFFKFLDSLNVSVPINEWKGLRMITHVLIDINIYSHKWASLKFDGSCIYGIVHHSIKWHNRNIIQCYIFDGPPPAMKSCPRRKRKQICRRDDLERIMKIFKANIIQAGGEAEALCATIAHRNMGKVLVDSTDSDALIFGSPFVYKSDKIYELSKIIKATGLKSRVQLIVFAILLGNDYNPKLMVPSKAITLAKRATNGNVMQLFNKVASSVSNIDPQKLYDVYQYYLNPYKKFQVCSYNLNKYKLPIITSDDIKKIVRELTNAGISKKQILQIVKKF